MPFKVLIAPKTENQLDSVLGGGGKFRKLLKIIVSMWDSRPEGMESKTISFHLKHFSGALGYCGDDTILLNRRLLKNKKRLVEIILHEATHLFQHLTRKLIVSDCGTFVWWRGKRRPSRFEDTGERYWSKPWEIESKIAERRAGEVLSMLSSQNMG